MGEEYENNKMKEEHDFSQGMRGKYAKAYHQGSNVVVLDPVVAERFPNAESVNQALRSLGSLMDGKHQPP
jgi:hypothetical protein